MGDLAVTREDQVKGDIFSIIAEVKSFSHIVFLQDRLGQRALNIRLDRVQVPLPDIGGQGTEIIVFIGGVLRFAVLHNGQFLIKLYP